MTTKKFWFYAFALVGATVMLFGSCEKENVPALSTIEVTEITQNTAISGGNITDDGGTTVTARGVCWSTNENPTIDDNKTEDGTGAGSFTSSISGLEPNTTYYVRAYATNTAGTGYGSAMSFTTLEAIDLPTVTTTDVTEITQTTATTGGNITEDGGAAVTSRGVCWSNTTNPTITNSHTTDGNGTGSFTSSITGLSANTTYYVKAYAINSEGTSYGSQLSFTTSQSTGLPTVTTAEASSIAETSSTLGGNVTDDGGASVTERGIYYGTSSNPESTGTKVTIGSGTGSFSQTISGLSSNTTYYVKAYAINSEGTSYGSQLSFTTSQSTDLPTVTTAEASSIAETSATLGGNVTDDGGASVTERGIYYGTSSNPESTGTKVMIGSGTGSFSQTISSLTSNTTYYVKAYAINSEGTAYGNELNFTTTSSGGQTGTVTDYDGNTYNTIQIGNQVWMAENLKTTHYGDGTAIPLVTDNTAWANLGDNNTDDAYCYYDNDANSQYGALYTWAAAMNGAASSTTNPSGIQGACPDGWHIPSDAEWTELTDYLGGASVAGGKMKETGTTHWTTPNTGATNESGFTALPGGYRGDSTGSFSSAGGYGGWWSSTEYTSTFAYYRDLFYDNAEVYRILNYKSSGLSVRCLKD